MTGGHPEWTTGVVTDTRQIALIPETPAGSYPLNVGLVTNGQRSHVIGESGQILGDFVSLGPIGGSMTSQPVSSQRQWERVRPSQDARRCRDVGLDLSSGGTSWRDAILASLSQLGLAGHAAGMSYLTRPDAVHKRQDPRHVQATARSVLVVAASYVGTRPPELPRLHGAVSRYAWGRPQRRVRRLPHWLLERLRALIGRIEDQIGRPIETQSCMSTRDRILERAWAQAAGLGWIGKNGLLIHPKLGSFPFLGVALVDVQLPPGTGANAIEMRHVHEVHATHAPVAPSCRPAWSTPVGASRTLRSSIAGRSRCATVRHLERGSLGAISVRTYVRGTADSWPATLAPASRPSPRSICRNCSRS